jgi:hypothetical protein
MPPLVRRASIGSACGSRLLGNSRAALTFKEGAAQERRAMPVTTVSDGSDGRLPGVTALESVSLAEDRALD